MAKSKKKKVKKWIQHYCSSHKILLVGEGDFSFAVCLATAFGSANNIVATSYDTEATVIWRHRNASANIELLEEMGCIVLHGVDASDMSTDHRLMIKVSKRRRIAEKFDRIVFNFPHAGFDYRESDCRQIKLHQEVVKGFLESASDMLTINGEVHITHKTSYPFCEWEIEKLAEDVGLRLVEKVSFSKYDYPGYLNKRGSGPKSDKTFPIGECCTFKFAKTYSHYLFSHWFRNRILDTVV